MRKSLLLLCFVILCVPPAHAGPPRLLKKVGRVIATHKLLLAETVVVEVSAQFDIHSSEAAFRRCPDCSEMQPLLPARPTPLQYQGYTGAFSIGFAAANWYILDVGKDPGCPATDTALWCKKDFWKDASLGLTAEWVSLHAYATHHNDSLQP
jgi:hypothetical protein